MAVDKVKEHRKTIDSLVARLEQTGRFDQILVEHSYPCVDTPSGDCDILAQRTHNGATVAFLFEVKYSRSDSKKEKAFTQLARAYKRFANTYNTLLCFYVAGTSTDYVVKYVPMRLPVHADR